MLNYDNFTVSNGIACPGASEDKHFAAVHAPLALGRPPSLGIFKIIFYCIVTYTCSRHLIQFPGRHNRNR